MPLRVRPVVIGLCALGLSTSGCIEKRKRRPGSDDAPAAAAATATARPGTLVTVADVDDALSGLVERGRLRVPYRADDPFHGAADPIVTIVEFSDFQCGFCQKLAGTLDDLVKNHPGDVRVVFKQFPLPMHENAPDGALGALAAQQQGKFWEMHDRLFGNPRAMTPADVETHAKALGLDMARFKAAVASKELQQRLNDEMNQGRVLEINSTPTFFVNGKLVKGARGLEDLEALVAEEKRHVDKLLNAGSTRAEVYARILRAATKGAGQPKKPPESKRGEPVPSVPYAFPAGDRPARGSEKPLVTVIELGDYTSPDHRGLYDALDQLRKKYPTEVRHVFRPLPLGREPVARNAARAVMAAARQGKFWEMHDRLSTGPLPANDTGMVALAKVMELDDAKFEADMNDPALDLRIEEDITLGNRFRGTQGPPAVFVNGRFVAGKIEFGTLDPLVKEEVDKAQKLLKDTKADPAALFEQMRKTWRGYDLAKQVEDRFAAAAARAADKAKAGEKPPAAPEGKSRVPSKAGGKADGKRRRRPGADTKSAADSKQP